MPETYLDQPAVPESAVWQLPQHNPEDLAARAEWGLVERIVASRGFSKSTHLANFLLYVSERHLRGRVHEITESQIGTRVFGRPKDYNPAEDNIVRTYARVLRKRLEEYFDGEGKSEPLQVQVPRGGYVPVFSPAPYFAEVSLVESAPASITLPVDELNEVREAPHQSRWWQKLRRWIFMSLAAISLMATSRFVWLLYAETQTPTKLLWGQLFRKDVPTLIVPTDSGWGILQNVTHREGHLSDYVNGLYFSDLAPPAGLDARNFNDLRTQHYTSMAALDITNRLLHLPAAGTGQSSVRYARDLRMEDLKHANVLLLGSVHANPWVELFEKDMNFRMKYDLQVDDSSVINTRPVTGEPASYSNEWNSPTHRTYGVIAYLPNLSQSGHVLIVEGLNMAATRAAAEVLLDDTALAPLLQPAVARNGTLKSFELLVETASIGVNTPGARVVASRFYPQ